jgi:uncharacterized pyridoxamine 5'-phosphate oxidase family protein
MANTEIINFLNTNSTHFVATVDHGEPRVRGLRAVRADEQGILYSAAATKDLVKQIKANPKVEILAFNAESGTQVRVHGDVEIVEDQAVKDEIASKRPPLKAAIEANGYDSLFAFRVVNGQLNIWKRGEKQTSTVWETL